MVSEHYGHMESPRGGQLTPPIPSVSWGPKSSFYPAKQVKHSLLAEIRRRSSSQYLALKMICHTLVACLGLIQAQFKFIPCLHMLGSRDSSCMSRKICRFSGIGIVRAVEICMGSGKTVLTCLFFFPQGETMPEVTADYSFP